jgi:hypothetical protein
MLNLKPRPHDVDTGGDVPTSSRSVASPDVAAWRPLAAGVVILIGGVGALVYGLARGELIYVLGTIGLTLLVAGLVDGTGHLYRGAGVALLSVFVSAKLLDRLPDFFQRGVAYGALMAAFGIYVIVKQWLGYRASAAGETRSAQTSR